MERIRHVVALAVAGACLAAGQAAAPAAETAGQSSLASLKGAWRGVSMVQAGSPVPKATAGQLLFLFSEEAITIAIGPKFVAETAYTVDAKAKPAAIDMTFQGEATLGIYEIGKDELRICLNDRGKGRPKSFPPKPARAATSTCASVATRAKRTRRCPFPLGNWHL